MIVNTKTDRIMIFITNMTLSLAGLFTGLIKAYLLYPAMITYGMAIYISKNPINGIPDR